MRSALPRRLATLVLVCTTIAGCSGSSALDGPALGKLADSLGSAAAEGAFLAQDLAASRTLDPFRNRHTSQLLEAARKAQIDVGRARVAADLDGDRAAIVTAAARVTDALARLRTVTPDAVNTVRDELRAEARTLHAIAERLG